MSTVHATATVSTSSKNTVRSRQKNPRRAACFRAGRTMVTDLFAIGPDHRSSNPMVVA